MPRTRVSEMHQRQSPRDPLQLRTSSSSDSVTFHHHRATDRSPKLGGGGGDRRSPRGTQSDPPVNQKKLDSRIADLESQLGQAQVELQCLKEQLTSAEAAKKAAQEQLEKKTKKQNLAVAKAKACVPSESGKKDNSSSSSNPSTCEIVNDNQQETDVFEVPVEPKAEPEPETDTNKAVDSSTAEAEPEKKPSVDEITLKNDEIVLLKAEVEAKGKELESCRDENENLKAQLSEKSIEVSSARVKQEMSLKLIQVQEEMETSKARAAETNNKLEASEKAREELENEMKKLRVQTEQWRKAADAAAAVLAGGVEMNGRRLSERCGTMDKHYSGNNFFGQAPPPVSSTFGGGYIGSPRLMDESEEVYGSGKRKGSSGIRMFGDLWKKKGQK